MNTPSAYFENNEQELVAFLQAAKSSGLDVYYLTGDPSWARTTGRDSLMKRVNLYADFTTKNPGLFSGIHFDIEDSKWFENDNTIAKEYLGNLKHIQETFPQLDVSIDIPFWLDSKGSAFVFDGKVKPFEEHLRDYTSFVTIMDYNEEASNVISFASKELQDGPTVIGLEFSDVASLGEPETITFYEEGTSYFEQEFVMMEQEFVKNNNFKGFAFHHYETFFEFYS